MNTSSLEIQEIKEVERDAEFDSPTKSTTTIEQANIDQKSTVAILVNEKPDSYHEEQDDRHRENGGIPPSVGADSISIGKANTSGDWSTDRNGAKDDAVVKRMVEQSDLEVSDVDARWRSSDRSRALLPAIFPWDHGGERTGDGLHWRSNASLEDRVNTAENYGAGRQRRSTENRTTMSSAPEVERDPPPPRVFSRGADMDDRSGAMSENNGLRWGLLHDGSCAWNHDTAIHICSRWLSFPGSGVSMPEALTVSNTTMEGGDMSAVSIETVEEVSYVLQVVKGAENLMLESRVSILKRSQMRLCTRDPSLYWANGKHKHIS
ncbi:hypothetical protein PIB30_058181 [Stylosanthes scabra]|uniref:Uncharacterized protein n=1 Tax=Stylosanthes scabra TaxID=79078 RepID=A0ABU6VI97_9FABA|nr:hypothetical protein [Stylosanthes scabra]